MSRHELLASLSLLLLATACGAGSAVSAMRPAERTAAGALNEGSGAACKDVGREGKPLVVDWKPEARGALEVAMQSGIAVVKYDCTTLKLLEGCHVDGTYGFKGIVLKQQVVRLDDADEVKVNLPLSGGVLAANLEGTAGRGFSLDLATALVGNRVSTRMTVTKADLSGACDGATHFVRGANIGAFVLEQNSKAEVKTALQIFKTGAGTGSESSKLSRQADGSLDACQSSSSEGDKPPANCAALVRLSLVGLSDAPAVGAKPAAPSGAVAVAVKDEADGCPEGLSLAEGKCSRITGSTRHVCKAGDLADCKAQCGAEDGWSCSRLGAILVTSGASSAAAAFKRSCELGHAGGCSNFGLLLSKGTGVAKDDAGAASFFAKACGGGDPTGCFNLGSMTYEGRGVAKDGAKAATLYRQACDAGSAAGCVNLGAAYDDGLGVPKDAAKAVALYKRACEGDKAEGCTNIGVAYSSGQGVAEDQAAATRYYARGCALGSAKSCEYAAKRTRDGKGVVTNPALPTPPPPVAAAAASSGETLRAAGLVWQTKPYEQPRRWADAQAYCGKLDLAGGGWRLPTKEELVTLYASNTPGTRDGDTYWSSTPAGGSTVWYVGFVGGGAYADEVVHFNRVRCARQDTVRGAALPTPPPAVAAVSGGDTLRAAGLVWQKTVGEDKPWARAKTYCETLDLTGRGWRLPTREELVALYKSNTPGTREAKGYWSSTPAGGSGAWGVYFGTGGTYTVGVDDFSRVRCVR